MANSLRTGNSWPRYSDEPLELTYAFSTRPQTDVYKSYAGDKEILPFGEGQRYATRHIFQEMESVANVRFVDVTDAPNLTPHITLFNTVRASPNNGDGLLSTIRSFAFRESSTYTDRDNGNIRKVDIGFDFWDAATEDYSPGSKGYYMLGHEILHAMALTHPRDYETAGVKSYRFSPYPPLPEQYDRPENTLMTYPHNKPENPHIDKGEAPYPSGLGKLDILALQMQYGPNLTATGPTVYSLTGKKNTNIVSDAGGSDIFNAAAGNTPAILDLRNTLESWSYVGEQQTGIAPGTTIEHAITGDADDSVTGNGADNIIITRGGNDEIAAGPGNDRILPGNGDNRVSAGPGADTAVIINGPVDSVTVIDDFTPGEDRLEFSGFPAAARTDMAIYERFMGFGAVRIDVPGENGSTHSVILGNIDDASTITQDMIDFPPPAQNLPGQDELYRRLPESVKPDMPPEVEMLVEAKKVGIRAGNDPNITPAALSRAQAAFGEFYHLLAESQSLSHVKDWLETQPDATPSMQEENKPAAPDSAPALPQPGR